jgi:hypothetical protein
VESALFEHPGVSEAAVVAAADERWGEVGHAFIVAAESETRPTPDELSDFLLARLAKYKVPKYFSLVDELPRTGSGKIHKVSLRSGDALGAHSSPAPTTRTAGRIQHHPHHRRTTNDTLPLVPPRRRLRTAEDDRHLRVPPVHRRGTPSESSPSIGLPSATPSTMRRSPRSANSSAPHLRFQPSC